MLHKFNNRFNPHSYEIHCNVNCKYILKIKPLSIIRLFEIPKAFVDLSSELFNINMRSVQKCFDVRE